MIGEKEGGFCCGIRRGGQHGVMAAGMEAKHDFGAGRFFEAQALRADGDASVRADFDERAHAPDIIPPRTTRGRAQDRAFFFFGVVPGAERSLAQFAMDFMGVMVGAQGVDVLVGFIELRDFFTGKVGRQAALPELVLAFDFAFGLGRGRVAQADVVELERPTQLGQGVGIAREKEAVVIDVKLERASVGEKGGGQKIEIGKQEFALVNFGTGGKTAAIIEQVEHGKGGLGVREPAMRRGVELPEFADLGALPAAHGSQDAFGRDAMSEVVGDGPMADLGAIEFESVQAQGFGSGEAVGARRLAGQTFFQQVQNRLGPGFGVIAAGVAGRPEMFLFFGTSQKISGEQNIKSTGRKAELFGRISSVDQMFAERVEYMADKGRSMAVDELLMFFKAVEYLRDLSAPPVFSSGIATLALLKDWRRGEK